MREFFTHIRRRRQSIINAHGDAFSFCISLSENPAACDLPEKISRLLREVDADDQEYAIGSAYALLVGNRRRKELSAYFTPPILARAAIAAGVPYLDNIEHSTVLDPACGGGSFATPMVRYLVGKIIEEGASRQSACAQAVSRIQAIELDTGLASLSQHLLNKMLIREFDYPKNDTCDIVRCGDALTFQLDHKYDLVIGNPPYGRIGDKVDDSRLKEFGLANMGGHTNLYSLFLLRGLDWVRPGGGMVYVLPPSFVAGPYFAGLRQEITRRAEVMQIELHEQRTNLFLGAVQDVCLLTLRRRDRNEERIYARSHRYKLGMISAAGTRIDCGYAIAKGDGEPWTLPTAFQANFGRIVKCASSARSRACVLSDYGYRVRVGKVVPTRERDSLHDNRCAGDLPLVWASSIRPDGRFEFQASKRLGNSPWFAPPIDREVKYAAKHPAVVVQRTSNRNQKRRLNAAAVPQTFRTQHKKRGFVAENHVIVVEAVSESPPVSPTVIAAILNSAVVNERFSTLCGSFSVSARLLRRLALPTLDQLPKPGTQSFEDSLKQSIARLDEVLAPNVQLETTRDLQDGLHKSCHLYSGWSIDKNTRLKRGAIA